ncbi:helicase associated domain-containing protein [Streptomyces sp. NPDC059909]|uniref:helicase associated domain-containing protein n=1 Tax=Streptomyces sp. NPDC059909 TaxID=3346998 RepID=UPI00365468E7
MIMTSRRRSPGAIFLALAAGTLSFAMLQPLIKLGVWIGNQRSRAATLAPERVEQLSAIGACGGRNRRDERPSGGHVHTSPGVYALLLGAGISIASGVKTGWGA